MEHLDIMRDFLYATLSESDEVWIKLPSLLGVDDALVLF